MKSTTRRSQNETILHSINHPTSNTTIKWAGGARKLPFVSWEYSTIHNGVLRKSFGFIGRGIYHCSGRAQYATKFQVARALTTLYGANPLRGGVGIVYSSRFSRHRIWALAPHPRRHCSKCRTYLAREPEYERLKCRIDSRVTRGTAPVAMYCSLRREIAAVTEVHKIISSLARPADLSM